MRHIAEAAARSGMPAVAFAATARTAAAVTAARKPASDARLDAQGGADAWSPPV